MTDQHYDVDYYSLLGVSADASASTIKAAFKRLALRYHPDVYHGADADEQMRLLLLAYRTLSDPAQRQAYDARRNGTNHHPATRQQSRPSQAAAGPPPAREVSPWARRDRNRYYAFPALSADAPAQVTLGEVSYTLSPEEARALKQQGLLRGTARAALSALTPEARASFPHYCHRCHHRWIPAEVESGIARLWELICPACKASDWHEYLLLRCIHCEAVFESEQIRDPLGPAGGALCPPYTLFPLCPSCGAARWCPAEDARVEGLRRRPARGRQSGRTRS